MKRLGFLLFVSSVAGLLDSCGVKEEMGSDKQTLFVTVNPEESNVQFINSVSDQESFNILTYRNFYNGGGVAIGDINNDGLSDIFFTSNLQSNKLYLNKGNFVFEDITSKAAIEGKRAWSTGVTMADVNNDGWLDIYVCNSGDIKGDDKENELFINNKDLTFTESGAKYNLNNKGLSTQASFFDYDLDGDLDCYILNNSFIAPDKIELFKNVRTETDEFGGDKLLRNDGGHFTDVTTESGVYSSKIGFGLGVSVSDINNDFLPDIYISNDFWERDYLYINQGNGKFKERLTELLSICSVSSMGADIADINNDGNPEIFTTDMLAADNYRLKAMTIFDNYQLSDIKYRGSYHYQILQNCLHLNTGNLNFQEVAGLSNVYASDWSWGALIFDFQNDGLGDIFVSNGITKDIMYVDFTDFISDKENIKKIVLEKGRFDWRDFIPYIPSNPIKSFGYVNKGNLIFENQSDSIGFGEPSFSNGAAYADLDNDGDLDLVVNNVNMIASVYRNQSNILSNNNYLKFRFKGDSLNQFGIGTTVKLHFGSESRVLQNFPSRGFQSSVEPYLNFGLGQVALVDRVEVIWPNKKMEILEKVKANQTILVDSKKAQLIDDAEVTTEKVLSIFTNSTANLKIDKAIHKENAYNDFNQEPLLVKMLSTESPDLVVGDVNNDQRDDFILLGAAGDEDKVFIQSSNGTFYKSKSLPQSDSIFESTCGILIDLNNDGNQDLIVGSGGNEPQKDKNYYRLRVYLGNGQGKFRKDDSQDLENIIGNFSSLAAYDFNGDGFKDLFIGSRIVPGSYGLIPKSFLLKNVNGKLSIVDGAIMSGAGMVTDAGWTDFDQDGDKDLLVVGDWMPITFYVNEEGVFTTKFTVPNSSGWWNSLKIADLDEDGDDDYVLGNWGQNIRFKASTAKPLTMFVKDFDKNGKSEFIVNWYPPLDKVAYPFATKMEMTQQLPFLRKGNLKYEEYAKRTYETLLPLDLREGALEYKTEVLQSSVLWNNNNGFTLESLPLEAQITPVFSTSISDFNGDGILDIWLGGNFYGLKPQVGRCNSSQGIFLKGSNNRKFESLKLSEAGIEVPGEVRDSEIIKVDNSSVLLVARNNSNVQAFSFNKK